MVNTKLTNDYLNTLIIQNVFIVLFLTFLYFGNIPVGFEIVGLVVIFIHLIFDCVIFYQNELVAIKRKGDEEITELVSNEENDNE